MPEPSTSAAAPSCEEHYPVTLAQEGLAALELLAPGNSGGTTAEMIVIDKRLDVDRLRQALEICLTEQPLMRVRLVVADGASYLAPDLAAHTELREATAGGEDELQEILAAELSRPLDPLTGQMTRALLVHTPDGDRLAHLAHHLVLDGMGAALYLRRLASVYNALGDGRVPEPPTGRLELAEMSAADQRLRASADHTAALRRWRDWLAELPARPPGPERVTTVGGLRRHTCEVPPTIRQALPQLAAQMNAPLADLLVALLAGIALDGPETEAACIGVPCSNRTGPGRVEWASVPSTAMTVLPVRVPDGAATLEQAVAEVATWRQRATAGGGITQERLIAWDRGEGQAKVPNAQLNVLPFAQTLHLDGQRAEVRNLTAGTTPGWTLTVRGSWSGRAPVQLELDVNQHVIDDGAELLDLAVHRLQQAVDICPGTPMSTLSRCTPTQSRYLQTLEASHDDVRPRTLLEAFQSGVRSSADAPSLTAPGGPGESDVILTGRQVWDISARLATALADRGVKRGDVVALAVPRSVGQLLVAHALLHLGAVYLPLHPDVPAGRGEAMCQQAQAVLTIDSALAAELRAEVDSGRHQAYRGQDKADVDDPAYVLFTSGSTGTPKGVVISHRAIDNRLQWMQDRCRLTAGEKVLYKTPSSFDVHIWELYWPLQVGGHVVVAPEGTERDPAALAELIRRHGVGIVHFVPGMLQAVLAVPSAVRDLQAASQLRLLVCSGEALGRDLAVAAREATGCWPLNLYGPTEAAVDVTHFDSGAAYDGPDVPLGRPVWNTACLVLDDHLRRVRPGECGQLYLAGPQLALGYLGRPDLTAAAFVTGPEGQRVYATGDLALWDEQGLLRYRGRRGGDRQVKVRGQRIELGEIEAVLCEVDGIGQALCHLRDAGGAVLVAHLLGPAMAEPEVRRQIRRQLTPVMRPSMLLFYDAFPTTINGKVDRRALQERAQQLPASAGRPPRTGAVDDSAEPADSAQSVVEQIVCHAFSTVLDTPVAATESFFSAGGDSLACIRLLGELESELGWSPRLAEFLAAPSPREVAERFAGRHTDCVDETKPAARAMWLAAPDEVSPDAAGAVPLVLLPPAGGLCWPYLPLAAHLRAERAVLGVLAPQLAGQRPADSGADALADWTLEAIRARIPAGPVHLAGWSSGGVAAHRLAARARHEVLSVTLLDAYPVETWQRRPEPGRGEQMAALLRMGGVDDRSVQPAPVDLVEVAQVLRQRESPLAAMGQQTLNACLESVTAAMALQRSGQSRRFAGTVLHIGAADSADSGLDAGAWELLSGRLHRERHLGSHVDLVRREHAAAVAETIGQHLAGAEAAAASPGR